MATKQEKPGYVYILTNPSFREDWVKIGMTQNVESRLRTLDNTALPLPFKKYATLQTVKYQKAEKIVHHYIERFTDLRIKSDRPLKYEFQRLDGGSTFYLLQTAIKTNK